MSNTASDKHPDQYVAYIIESLPPSDAGEGLQIRHNMRADDMRAEFRFSETREEFLLHIRECADHFRENCVHAGEYPNIYLHLSCHGSPEYLETADRAQITWPEVDDALYAFNESISGFVPSQDGNPAYSLVNLALSACHGIHAANHFAHRPATRTTPFHVLIAPDDAISLKECPEVFVEFYRLMHSPSMNGLRALRIANDKYSGKAGARIKAFYPRELRSIIAR